MKMSESIKSISKAFAKAQSEIKDLFKDTKGYNYKYATLDATLKEIRTVNGQNGLFFTQNSTIRENEIVTTTTVIHESGEWFMFESCLPFAKMKGMNDYQSAGSGFTYSRRYALSSIFGIASDEDKDGAGEQRRKESRSNTSKPVSQKKTQSKFVKELIKVTEGNKAYNDIVVELLAGKKADEIPENEQEAFLRIVAKSISMSANN